MSARRPDRSACSRAWSLGDEHGLSLVEVLAAVVVSMLVVAAGFTTLITSEKAAKINEVVARTQSNARVAMQLVAREMKLAGFGMTTGAVGACAAPIVPADDNTAGADTGPDSVSLVVPVTNANPAVGALWQLNANAIGPFTVITLPGGAPTAVADMVTAGLAVNSTISIGGAISSTVSAIDAPAANQLTLTDQIGAPKTFPIGTQVHLLECVTYAISNAAGVCDGNQPCLTRTANGTTVSLVDGIEDLQLAYACDGCDGSAPDGVPDDQNGNNAFDRPDFITDSTWAVGAETADKIRLVEITIVARQIVPDEGISESGARAVVSPTPVVASDHDHVSGVFAAGDYVAATYSQQRRRVLTRVVETRNMGP